MDTIAPSTDFFKAGGTLPPNIPSYITRLADAELFQRVRAGQFCYVLTSRQMGKSSLMIRTAQRLRKKGVQTAIIDLSALGTQVNSSQWYLGLVTRLAAQLDLPADVEAWWQERAALSVVQRFTDFVLEVVLAQTEGPIVVFVDEIDSTLKLDFTDDFFAAIRNFYNARAGNTIYERITFVLLGVASPTDLIQNRNLTPFNIGHPVALSELTRTDAQPLAAGLEQHYPGHGDAVLDRIFFWTSGHPYLTQTICVEAVGQAGDEWKGGRARVGAEGTRGRFDKISPAPTHAPTVGLVDGVVQRLFLDKDAQNEDNLQFVRSNVEASRERRRLLQLYRRVYAEEQVGDDDRSPQQGRLKLIGLVRAADGRLHVRNRIYGTVFNSAWIKQNMPVEWTRIVIWASVAVIVAAIAALIINQQIRQRQTFEIERAIFQAPDRSASVRLASLAGMCNINAARGRELFFGQPPTEQLGLFADPSSTGAGPKLVMAARCVASGLDAQSGEHGQQLANAIEERLKARCDEQDIEMSQNECHLGGR